MIDAKPLRFCEEGWRQVRQKNATCPRSLGSNRLPFVLRQSAASATRRKPRKMRKRRFGLSRLWPGARARRQWFRAFRRASPTTQAVVAAAVAFTLWLGLNWAYQVIRKPSELFFPVSGALYKTPLEAWQEYGPIFRQHATAVITPDLLAALAQVEGSGNPVARTYWRWSFRRKPFEVYRPASSAVGMYQITNGTFAEARRYCIHDHIVIEDGPGPSLTRAGSTASIRGPCRRTPSNSCPRTWTAASRIR